MAGCQRGILSAGGRELGAADEVPRCPGRAAAAPRHGKCRESAVLLRIDQRGAVSIGK